MRETKEDFKFFGEKNESLDNYVDKSMEIVDRINVLLAQSDLSKKDLADKMNKSQSEISKWFNGVHNFTIKTLAKLEVAFGEPIFLPYNGEEFLKAERKNNNTIIVNDTEFYGGEVLKLLPLRNKEENYDFITFPLLSNISMRPVRNYIKIKADSQQTKTHSTLITFNDKALNG
jgi:transcriptional regulator with XRE-family HTH domain